MQHGDRADCAGAFVHDPGLRWPIACCRRKRKVLEASGFSVAAAIGSIRALAAPPIAAGSNFEGLSSSAWLPGGASAGQPLAPEGPRTSGSFYRDKIAERSGQNGPFA